MPDVVAERVTRGPAPRIGRLLLALVGLVVLAIAKPWTVASPDAGPGRGAIAFDAASPTPAAAAAASPTPGPTLAALDPNATPCMSANGERLVTLIRTPEQDVRSWQLVDGAEGQVAFSAGLTPVRISSEHVIGLGLCVDRRTTQPGLRAAAEVIDVILISPADGGIEDLGRPATITLGRGLDDAVLYGAPMAFRIGPDGSSAAPPDAVPPDAVPPDAVPPDAVPSSPEPSPDATSPGRVPVDATWRSGMYAAAFRYDSDAPGTVRWIRFEVVAAPGIFG